MESSVPGRSTSRPVGRTVGDVGERAVLAELIGAVDESAARGAGASDITVVGTGDDAAVFAASGDTAISTDTIVEGRHFRLDLSSPREIGARAVVQSVADVAAMGARITGVVVSIAVPGSTDVAVVTEINRGIAGAARDLGAPWWRIHWRIVIPFAKPGIVSGCTMVFMLAAGALAAPQILGGPSSLWFTQIIYGTFFEAVNWPRGAAYAIILLVACIVLVLTALRLFRVRLGEIGR